MEDTRMRADVALCARGLAASREKAQGLIEAGLAFADGKCILKASQKIDAYAELTVQGDFCPYVSRGGFKLEKALKCFGVDVSGKVCMDVGASTGGFTDVLLQSGADYVYAIDVGTGQLDAKIESDARVCKMEQTNARTLTAEMFPRRPELAVMDVSFISVLKILPALRAVLGESGRVISLIKPQFEAGKAQLGKKGVISNAAVHESVLRSIAANAPETGWRVRAFEFSPIAGTQGNLEFLAEFVPDGGTEAMIDPKAIRDLVQAAHRELKKKK